MRSRGDHRKAVPVKHRTAPAIPSASLSETVAESIASARQAGLMYVTDQDPGIQRLPRGKSFRYLDAHGKPVRDQTVLARIRSLVIPPAWTDVWICPSARGHLQATGRDARGRKQYRYHPLYRAQRDETKYEGLIEFAESLPRIRRRVCRDLSRRGIPKERALATVVSLLDQTCIRVGNAEYARDNDSFGVTTLRNSHARVTGTTIRLRFKAKSGQLQTFELSDRRLARIVRRCHDLPGQKLFQYVDENGETRAVDSSMVNEYLRDVSGRDITAKHFRTWHGTVRAALHLHACDDALTETECKRNVVAAVKAAAQFLGNRPATCRKYYIYPGILDAYSDGRLGPAMSVECRCRRRHWSREEHCVMNLLRRGYSAPARRTAAGNRRLSQHRNTTSAARTLAR